MALLQKIFFNFRHCSELSSSVFLRNKNRDSDFRKCLVPAWPLQTRHTPSPPCFERWLCLDSPSLPRPGRTQRRSPVLIDLSAFSVWNTQARRVLCVCCAALRSTEPWPRHLHGSSQPAAPPVNAMSLSAPSSLESLQCMASPSAPRPSGPPRPLLAAAAPVPPRPHPLFAFSPITMCLEATALVSLQGMQGTPPHPDSSTRVWRPRIAGVHSMTASSGLGPFWVRLTNNRASPPPTNRYCKLSATWE